MFDLLASRNGTQCDGGTRRDFLKVGALGMSAFLLPDLLKRRGVSMLSGAEYEKIDDSGLHLKVDGEPLLLDVDTIVICAGQEPRRELVADLEAAGIKAKLIGGADVAAEFDAKRAIDQGTRVALEL